MTPEELKHLMQGQEQPEPTDEQRKAARAEVEELKPEVENLIHYFEERGIQPQKADKIMTLLHVTLTCKTKVG